MAKPQASPESNEEERYFVEKEKVRRVVWKQSPLERSRDSGGCRAGLVAQCTSFPVGAHN